MSYGHASHQSGLDADIWLMTAPEQPLTDEERENLGASSMVSGSGVDLYTNDQWGEWQVSAVRTAAMSPAVDRIFINPAIKRTLCDRETGDRSWLQKLRPWWGHDAHFHVRLGCPTDSPLCVQQPFLPAGDGCDDSLAWWFSAEAAEELANRRQGGPGRTLTLADLPPACASVYYAE
ncbi:MAG: penicillin-insensitive murein endopeptidase [Rhodospirillales bacterium]|nr:penicillin-insensitive murein endopeptidase [Rhodospirillales bacterium]